MSDLEKLMATGTVETVGDILEKGEARAPNAPPARFVPARLGETCPPFPEPGNPLHSLRRMP